VIDVSKDQLVYRSYLAEKVPGASTDKNVGDVYDEFTVTKYDDGEKWVTEAGMTPPAPQVPAVQLTASSVQAGASLEVSGTGFAAGEELVFELRSDPVRVGAVTADADGAFRTTVAIPAATDAGQHTLAVIRADGSEVTSALTVTAAAVVPGDGDDGGEPGTTDPDAGAGAGAGSGSGSGPDAGSLATTGADSIPYVITAAVLLALGSVLLVARRRARSDSE